MIKKYGFKKGAASFYIVAFSTLILLIVATSFAAIIISEVTRTSNDDLSQSAYDSALAGVEDAKLAFYNYQSCIAQGATAVEPNKEDGNITCGEIVYYMENEDCDMVAHALGRINESEESEVFIKESSSSENNMMQAYTCNKVKRNTSDYRSSLSSSNQIKVIQPKFANGVKAKDIEYVRINWFAVGDGDYFNYANFDSNSGNVAFKPYSAEVATPPTLSVAMLQTASNFTLADFESSRSDQTNRGMVYLVPFGKKDKERIKSNGSFELAYNAENNRNFIGTEGFVTSNNKLGGENKNLPYAVYCPEHNADDNNGEFACSVTIALPKPINGDNERNDETFFFIVSLPYGSPKTDFSLELFCNDDKICSSESPASIDPSSEESSGTSQAILSGVQIEIDSTGRANNLYRRVVARLEPGADDFPLSIMGPLELLGESDGDALNKNYSVIKEYNFLSRP